MNEQSKNGKYKVFISEKPEILLDIPAEKRQLLRDHKVIFGALSDKELSAKEIHELYREKDQSYSKSMKTVYRYLDLLEEEGLIKIAGYRKAIDSRATEKLYCRTARLFYTPEKTKWWELPEYRKYFEKKTDFFVKLKNDKSLNKNVLHDLIIAFTEARDKYINQNLNFIRKHPESVEILSNLSIMEIKGIITDLATLEMLINEHELIEKIKDLK